MMRGGRPLLLLALLLAPAPGPAGAPVEAARVLMVAPLSSGRQLGALVRALAARGHHVTAVSHCPHQSPPVNNTNISLHNGPIPSPKDVQERLGPSERGVVHLSVGALDWLSQRQVRAVLRAVASLPQKVLWIVVPDHLPPLPKNVMASEWLPQNDVLNHPRTVAFIPLVSLLGVQEAVSAGVPMLVVPVLPDQLHSAGSLASLVVGLILTVSQLSEHTLRDTLHQFVNDTSYLDHAQQLSALFHDRPHPPLEEAVYWLEYDIRHRGAPHMPWYLHLPWYQHLSLVLLTVALALASVYAGLRWILGPLLAGGAAQRDTV